MKLPLKTWLALWLGYCVSLAPAGAQGPPLAAPVLRVGVSPVFPPMVFKQGKELAGVEVDLARALGEKLGRKVTFVELPWEEQIEALSAGRIDIIMSSMSITTARRYVVDFSRPYLLVGQMTLVRREDEHQYLLGFPETTRNSGRPQGHDRRIPGAARIPKGQPQGVQFRSAGRAGAQEEEN